MSENDNPDGGWNFITLLEFFYFGRVTFISLKKYTSGYPDPFFFGDPRDGFLIRTNFKTEKKKKKLRVYLACMKIDK